MTCEKVEQARLERHDTLALAIEQFGYLEAVFASLADTLKQVDPETEKVARARQLARLGRGYAEQWASTFLGDMDADPITP